MARTPTLLDAQGRPVQRQALTRPAAQPGLTGIRPVWAGTVASGLTPVRLAHILRACDEGEIRDYAILAEEMEERDPHYASVLGVRKRIVSAVAPEVRPASEDAADERVAGAVREAIAGHDGFPNLVEDLLDALGKGVAVVEIDWRRTARSWWPEEFHHRPLAFFRWDRETGEELRLLDDDAPVDGRPLEPFKFLVHQARLKSGHPARAGLARLVAFSWMCKAYALKDWMAFVETYGLPIRLGRYGPSASREDVEKLFTAVANIGTDAAAVLPESMRIEFESATGTQSEAVFENLSRYLDEQVSKAVLGQTMTADDGSSLAQAQVHDGVRHDIAAADARAVTATLNRDLVRPFVDLNFGPQRVYPRLVVDIEEPEDTDMILRHTPALAASGVRIRAAEVRARLGYSEPDAEDEVIGGAADVALNARRPELHAAGPSDELDEIEAAMLENWEPVMEEALGPVERAIREATGYEDALARLAALDELPAAALIEELVKGLFKARVTGDVQDG